MNLIRLKSVLKSGNIEDVNQEFLSIKEEIKGLSFSDFEPACLKRDLFAEVLFTGENVKRIKERRINAEEFDIKAAW